MSRGYNRVTLMGRMAKDPDVRFTPQKQKVARFTIAVGQEWKDKASGDKKSRADFISCVAWSFNADICERYLKKGNPVLVEGRISVRDYDDQKTGQRRWVTEVVVDNIVLMGSNQGNSGAPSSYEHPSNSNYQPKSGVSGDLGYTQPSFEEEFPLDFSDMPDEPGNDVDIPF